MLSREGDCVAPAGHPSWTEKTGSEPFDALAELAETVRRENACALPGVPIVYDRFMTSLLRATCRGFVTEENCAFIKDVLTYGAKLGVDVDQMQGHRHFRNHPSAIEAREGVSRSLGKRVAAQKTLVVGPWTHDLARAVRGIYTATAIFPYGAAPKSDGGTRALSDHKKTGLNAASDLEPFKHKILSYSEIAWFFGTNYFMRVSDVADAFAHLPIAPELWPFFFSRFWLEHRGPLYLLVNVCCDFGTAGMPGTFKRFFVDGVVQMARSEQVLTLPMAIHVDDCALMGPDRCQVDNEMLGFHWWCSLLGVFFKAAKDRPAAMCQYVIGFWWNSVDRTRTLDPAKRDEYSAMLDEMCGRPSLTLNEMQVAAGRIQRCVMTFPPGAGCLLSGLFGLMTGLRFAWQRRRLTRAIKLDFPIVRRLLQWNHGRGFFSYLGLPRAGEVRSDASRGSLYAGGGYVDVWGRYSLWRYTRSAARSLIDYLEGDAVTVATAELGHSWRGCIVPFAVDNRTIEGSGSRGRSRAERLRFLMYEFFALQLRYGFVYSFYWISSEANYLADDLSRGREAEFLAKVDESGFLAPGAFLQRSASAGRERALPERRRAFEDVPEQPTRAPPPVRRGRAVGRTWITLCLFVTCVVEQTEAVTPLAVHGGLPLVAVILGAIIAVGGVILGASLPAIARAGRAWAAEGGAARAQAPPGRQQQRRRRAHVAGAVRPRPAQAPRVRRANMGTTILSMCLLCGCAAAPGDGGGHQPFARSSVFQGLPCRWVRPVESVFDNRLAPSSWRTVNAAMKYWKETCLQYGWSVIIYTDDPERGGKLAACVMSMVVDTKLVFGSIEGYAWGICTWQQMMHQADPRLGVVDWTMFMAGVKVLTWVPGEPRKAVPFAIVAAIIRATDVRNFASVQLVFLILLLVYTFSRSESGLCKTFEGRERFDKTEHMTVSDVDIGQVQDESGNTVRGLWVRFKKIKQDQRVERPEARGDGDWAFVGDVADSRYSIIAWFVRLMGFHIAVLNARRDPDEPFFLETVDGRRRPLRYAPAMDQFKAAQRAVGVAAGEEGGLHGLRVEGYNNSKRVLGEDVTVAHGLWKSDAHKRYSRFPMGLVAQIPAAVSGVLRAEGGGAAEGAQPAARSASAPAERGPPAVRLTREALQGGGSAAATASGAVAAVDGRVQGPANVVPEGGDEAGDVHTSIAEAEAASEANLLPDGWRLSQGGGYVGPDGRSALSRADAWREWDESSRAEADGDALPDYLSYDDDGEAGASDSDSMPGLEEVSDFAINAME